MFSIFLPANAKSIKDCWDFFTFLDEMACRWYQGHCRFGNPQRKHRYWSRLKAEQRAYDRTGNREHLRNIANYAYLESLKPQHPLAHADNTVDSVTRHFDV